MLHSTLVRYFVPVIVHLHKFLEDLDLSRSTYSVASSPGRFFVYVMAGEKIWPGINCMCMRTILAQIALTYTKGIHLVTYSAYYTVIPGYDSVLWKLALAMASSSFNFDRV